ncbi:hypothetical protein [Amycolatopsis japonica]
MPIQGFPAENRPDHTTQHERRITVSHICAYEPDYDSEAALDAEFDRLLAQSSLGTPMAQAYQALTPDTVHQRLRERLDPPIDGGGALGTRGVPDADEVVLDVVRSAVGDPLPDTPWPHFTFVVVNGCEATPSPAWTVPRWDETDLLSPVDVAVFGHYLRLSEHLPCYRRWAVRLLTDMVLQGVFVDLRPDVARRIVEIGFDRSEEAPPALVYACMSSVPSSGITDELITSAFLECPMPPVSTAPPPHQGRRWVLLDFPYLRTTAPFHGRYVLPWKLLERGPLGTPRPALTAADPLSSGTIAACSGRPRSPRRRGAREAGRRRHRPAQRHRRGRLCLSAPTASFRPLRAFRSAESALSGTLAGLPLVAASGVGVLLIGILLVLVHRLP